MSTGNLKPYFYIDVNKLRNKYEIYIKEKIQLFKTQNLAENKSLNEDKDQKILLYKDDSEEMFNQNCYGYSPNNENYINNEIYYNNNNNKIKHNLVNTNNSSNENSDNNKYNNSSSIENEKSKFSFSNKRAQFYMKYKLYDFPLYQNGLNVIIPKKYFINEDLFGFVYPDELKTFYITKSGFLGTNNNIKELDGAAQHGRVPAHHDNINFDYSLGLYFCGKEIKIENETKICAPNEFMCKECMELNKKKYNINDNYLININGRVAKINKRSYHCFGKFLSGKEIEDCIMKFSCKACKLLDDNSNYYINN